MPYKDEEKRKEASRASAARWSAKNKDKAAANAKAWRRRNPECILVHAAKRRAKQKEIEFSLTTETCPRVPEVCPVLGIKLAFREDEQKGPWDNSPTLDRVDPNKGYTVENTRVISFKANRLKSDMTREDLLNLLHYMDNNLPHYPEEPPF